MAFIVSGYHRQFNTKREKSQMARQSLVPMNKLCSDETESHTKTLKPSRRKSLGQFLDRRRQSVFQVLNGLRVKSSPASGYHSTASSPSSQQLRIKKQIAEKARLYNQK